MRRITLVAALLALAWPAAAQAHARLIASTPANGQVVHTAPTAAVMQFDDGVVVGPGNAAVDAGGHSVLDGVARARGHVLTIPLGRLEQGSYTVRWSVVSDDGHNESGIVAFAVGTGQPHATLTARSGGPPAGDVFDRWLLIAGILVAGGASLFAAAIGRSRRVVLLVLAAFTAAAAGAALEWHRVPAGTRFGHAMLAVVAVAVVGGAIAAASAFRPAATPLLTVPAAAAVVATSVSGHAVDAGVPRYQVAADIVHLGAASVWVGGLAAVALTGAGARRFSPIALVAVATVAVTGAIRALSELSAVDQLWSTSYGRALIAKTAILAGLVSLAVQSRRRAHHDAPGLRRTVAGELVLGVLLVVAVAVLTAVAPGRISSAAPAVAVTSGRPAVAPPGALTLARQLGPYGVAVAVSPGTGSLPVQVTVLGPQGSGVAGLKVEVAGRAATGCGGGCYETRAPAGGALTVTVAGRPATFELPPQPFRTAMPLLRRIGERLLRARTVSFRERLSSGPGQVVFSQWRLEAPASLAFTASDGSSGVIVGGRRWDHEPGGRWIESVQSPRVPQPQLPWPAFPANVVDLGTATVAGRKVDRLSFFDPRTPAWYTVAADAQTAAVVQVGMVAPAHFMRDDYVGLDLPFRISAPTR
ncbi:MAG TPA: copper resistance protein CopC [Acidimicrobiales bacterium]|nr:copper resistance protein CopC [Acidimicrobiales bacterium]